VRRASSNRKAANTVRKGRMQARGQPRHQHGGQHGQQPDRQADTPVQRVVAAIAPPAQQQYRHHHGQRSALRQRLLHAQRQGQKRNGDDAAPDAEDAAQESPAWRPRQWSN
jgi:hypothetical protein